MPNRETFKIKPIKELVERVVASGLGWVDPFAGFNSPAELTNDLNMNAPTRHHLHAFEFAKLILPKRRGAIFDPPYSPRQIKEVYDKIGWKSTPEDFQSWWRIKDVLAKKIYIGGKAICCGWNSMGFGKKNGFKMVEILLVSHGREHHDTICTVEEKIQEGKC